MYIKTIQIFCLAALLPVLGATVSAADLRIAVVDMRKVFEKYYKTVQASANLQEEKADIDKDYKDLMEKFKKGEDEWKKLLDKANDQAISSEEREKSKQTAEKKLLELKEMEQTIKQFERINTSKMNDKQDRLREKIVAEIRDVINAKAKAANYSLVIDQGGKSVGGTPIILFASGENDLTDPVLTQLNASAPPSVSKPADPKKEK